MGYLPASHMVAGSVIRWTVVVSQCLCLNNPYLLDNGPKCKSSDADNSDMLKRGCQVLPLSEKVKAPDKERKKIIY